MSLFMSNNFYASEKVSKIIYGFIEKLFMHGINRERGLLLAISILCKAKGQCNVLTHVEDELNAYNITAEDIDRVVVAIRDVCGEDLNEILPECADTIISKYSNVFWGVFIQPREISELVLSLVKEKGCRVIYNPFAGLASYAIAEFIDKYYGQEIDFATSNIAKMRLELYNIDYSNYVNGDSIKEWDDHGADCIVSTPPFGEHLNIRGSYSGASSFDEFVIKKYLDSSVNYAFLIVSRSFCYSTGRYSNIKKEIIEKNCLDMIIDLPANLFSNTSIATSLIVLNKQRNKNDLITFIDGAQSLDKQKNVLDIHAIKYMISANNHPNKANVSYEDVVNTDYLFSSSRYTLNLEIPEGYRKVAMYEIADLSMTGGRDDKDGQKGEYLKDDTLLLSLMFPRVENIPASSENPIFIKQGKYVKCKLHENQIDREYFIYKFEHLDKKILNAYMTGATIKRFTLRTLSDLTFCIPDSIQSQKNALLEAKQAEIEARVRESGLEKLLEQKKKEFIDIVRTRKHDMRPYVRELGSIERMMRQYIKNIDASNISSKMISLLDQHKIALDKLKDLIDIFSEEQQFGMPEQFNINEYFVDLEINHDETTGYRIEYGRDDDAIAQYGIPVPCGGPYDKNFEPLDPDSELYKEAMEEIIKFPLIVDINHVDFERLVRNIIENAVTHGFTDTNRVDYVIGIALTIDMDKGMFQIDFSNNGTPLPSGMDKRRYGILGEKAGISGRTGRGGYIVKSIVEHYHGDYDVFMDGQNTVVRILLPISDYDYEDECEI